MIPEYENTDAPHRMVFDCRCLRCGGDFLAVPDWGLDDKECRHCHQKTNVHEMMRVYAKKVYEEIKQYL